MNHFYSYQQLPEIQSLKQDQEKKRSTSDHIRFRQQNNRSGNLYMAAILISLFTILLPAKVYGQAAGHEAEWNGNGYSLKKVVSNTSIQSGVNFSYTILFSAPAGATSVYIQDDVPANLEVVSVPTPSAVNGVTPTVTISGQTVTYSLGSLPAGNASSGSFTIVVKFPEGITCDGTSVRNRAGIRIDDKWNYTPYVSTTAVAADPWKVTKSIVSGVVTNPGGGNCGYLMAPGDTVTYRLSVLKKSPFYGNVVGQQNMNNAVVTDQLPPGAVFVSSSCGVTPPLSGNTFSWNPNGGNLNAATPYANYYCDITVYYPTGSFPVGTIINNDASLNGDMCSQQLSYASNTTCIEVANIVPVADAYFRKYIYMTNRVPGCDGYYRVAFYNNGNVPLSPFTINDAIPAGITVNSVRVYGGNTTTTMSLTANNGADILNPSITVPSWNSGALNVTVNDLQWNMTNSLPVGQWVNLYIYFTVNSNPTGTVVQNCATFDGLSNNLTLTPVCVNFTVDACEPRPCVLKEVCSPDDSYDPGDILRFRLRVQNIGSADITGASLQDVLHTNFTYVGNETYYTANSYNPPCAGAVLPPGSSSWSGVTTNHSGNNLSWNLPDIDSDCQLFYTAACGYYGTWTLPYYFIEFDVKVDSLAMPGVTPNNYSISGGNIPSPVTSNTTHTLVVASFGQEVTKEVSSNGGTSYAASATVSAGATARYRLNYKNKSNVPVTSVSLVDLLPMNDGSDDWLILNRNIVRGSQFGINYLNTSTHATSLQPSGTAPSPTIGFAAGQNICLPDFGMTLGCTSSSWGGTPGPNVRMDYGTFALAPGVMLREDFDVEVPSGATPQQTACNDFAAISTANFLINSAPQTVVLTPIAAAPVCLTVSDGTGNACCEGTQSEVFQDPDLGDCCIRLATKCEVDSVVINISNGTLSNAAWNCGALANDFMGQESYTFTGGNCAIDMNVCVAPDSTGTVTVGYTIHFSNGEVCEDRIQTDCKVSEPVCCDDVTVKVYQDPDMGTCCAQFISKCETDSVKVNILNGTFVTASLNGTSLSSGFAGQSSFTFDANTTAASLITCITPDSTGVVYINYVSYFANGEQCENRVEMDCKAPDPPASDCCPVVDFKLRRSWPFFSKYTGTFEILNPDPSNPICSVEISSSPAGTFNAGTLMIDGTASGQSWNSTSVPATGSLSPQAENELLFTLSAFSYKGTITICVTKCDGTECCYEFNWNGKPIVVTPWEPAQLGVESKLVAVTVSPVMDESLEERVKYISFGFAKEADLDSDAEFFAIGGSGDCDDQASYPTPGVVDPDDDGDGISTAVESYMGRHNAFFELRCPYSPGGEEKNPEFNLVFKGGLPKLGMTLISEEGNVIFDGEIDLANPDSVISSILNPGEKSASMFEFINLYPNPAHNSFRISYATGNQQDVEIRLMNSLGQTIRTIPAEKKMPGLHHLDINVNGLAAGTYRVFLHSAGEVRYRPVIINP